MRKLKSPNRNGKLRAHKSAGFTLIEMCIVLIIIGLILGASAQLYKQRIEFLRMEDTQEDIEVVRGALASFLAMNGRYPCPASLTATRDNGQPYGREEACTGLTMTIAGNGIQTLNGTTTAGVAANVHLGGVPFKELNLREDQMIDGYRNRLIYAVTDSMTDQDLFNPADGAINVQDTRDADNNGVHFVLFSTGEDAIGGFTAEGTQAVPCDNTNSKGQNCDFLIGQNDATFVNADLSKGNNANRADDIMVFNTNRDMPQWELTEGTDHVNMKIPGNLGISPGAAENPEEELDVAGVIRAQDNLQTETQEGQIHSNSICNYSDKEKCFVSSLIGGEDPKMECPDGLHMVGIKHGQAVCDNKIEVKCTPGTMLTGIDSNGKLICTQMDCPSVEIPICGSPQTILAGTEGARRTLTGGSNVGNLKEETYVCRNTQWKLEEEKGLCECTPRTEGVPFEGNCPTVEGNCGSQFSGKAMYQRTYVCPEGEMRDVVVSSTCECNPMSEQTTTVACPKGFNTGSITQKSSFNCETNQCGPATVIENTCKCDAYTQPQTRLCPDGKGKYYRERTFVCPKGPDSPGWVTPWREVEGQGQDDLCECKPSSKTETEDCKDGEVGKREVRYDYTCKAGSATPVETITVVNDTCRTPPPIQCKWKWDASTVSGMGDGVLGVESNTLCNCDTDKGKATQCSNASGASGKYAHGVCICQPLGGGS